MQDVAAALVALARVFGDPAADLAILAEGNVSGRLNETEFLVKASGFHMGSIGPDGFVAMRFAPILAALNGPDLSDADVRACLAAGRVNPDGTVMPSVETFMHAYLLGLPDVNVIGHTHPTPLISLLSLDGAESRAAQRLFPDEVVCCGPATAFVPYTDPGLPLARAIRTSVEGFVAAHGEIPKTIWLANHGLITLGKTARDAQSASLMAVKAARAWLGALSTGRAIQPLSAEEIARIHTRPDEHYRQRLLWAIAQGSDGTL